MATKKLWILILLFSCLSMMLSSMEIKSAQATTVTIARTFSSLTYDGITGRQGTVYDTEWSASQSSTKYDALDHGVIGQAFAVGTYSIGRSFVFFDTSIIPSSASITNATLSLYISWHDTPVDFNTTIQSGQPNYPNMPIQLGDYDKAKYSGDGGSRNTSTFTLYTYWNITLNVDGVAWIQKDDVTKFCLRSSRDINGDAPTTTEIFDFSSSEAGSSYAPKLYVTYEVEGYRYIVHGPYYEDGDVANSNASVTLYSKTSDPYEFQINGTDGTADTVELNVEQAGWYFQWNASASMTRTYYLTTITFDEFWIYVADPNIVYQVYTISFLDLAGVLKSMPYVSVERYINGIKIVERQKADVENKVSFYLEKWAAYTIVFGDTTLTYTFGDVLFAESTTITLTVKAVDFPKATLFTYKYVRVYGERAWSSPYGTITITYQDILNMTNSVQIWISYKNGTTIKYDTETTNSFIYSWSLARNDTDYQVTLGIDHQQYGYYGWKQYFPRTFSDAPWGLGWFGNLPFNSAYLIPAFLIIFFGGAGTVINAYVGAILMVSVAAILAYMGWIPIPGAALVTAFTFAIMMAIIYAKKRIQT